MTKELWKKYFLIVFIAIIAILLADKIKNYFDQREIKKLAELITQNNQSEYEEEYQKIYKLTTGVQITYFDDLLGKPIFLSPHDYYTYIDKDYFVNVTTDENDKVTSYAVTTRNKDFKPTFEMSGMFKVQLNETVFNDWLVTDYRPMWCYHFMGAHDPILYFEQNFFGNPGLYQSYSVGISNSGNISGIPSLIPEGGDILGGLGEVRCTQISADDRKHLTPNTFVVSNGRSDDKWLNLGANSLETRLLKD